MKKLYSFIIFFIAFHIVHAQTLSIEGVDYDIDTLENHQVGPGTDYVSLRLTAPNKRMDVFFLKTDITNPHIEIRTALGRDSIYGGEAPSKLAKRISSEGNLYFGGTNGDFYSFEAPYSAYPTNGNMVNGEIAKIPISRNVFTIDDQKIPDIGIMTYSGYINYGGSTWTINTVNHIRNADQLVLYNRHNGKYTHTNAYGTEVLIELKDGHSWGSNKLLKAKVLKIEKRIGNMAIPKGKAVLSGHSAAAVKLNLLNVGDEVELCLNLSINTNNTSNFLQMSGGDNYKTMLLNGVVEQSSVWATREPRTGLGFSQNKDSVLFCVVDGRGKSIGATTKELAQIMKSAGAYTAFNMDGGGSSSMYVAAYGGPVNKTSDGNERATANGVFVVSTAPSDKTVDIIKPYQSTITLSKYGEYSPQFYGYNQYGVLLNSDQQGVVLSCPASLGTIVGKKFIATGNTAGNITATYNDTITATIPVSFIPVSEINILLDSVIVDNRSDYAIEVVAKTTNGQSLIPPSALNWNVSDPTICQIENGMVKALKSGVTTVTGEIDQVTDELKINVEIPTTPTMIGDSLQTANWTLNASSLLNAQLNQENLPMNWEYGAGINFIHAAGDSSYIKLTNQRFFYGMPDTIKLVLNTGDVIITKAIFTLKANDASSASFEFNNFEQNKDISLNIPVNKIFDTKSRIIYPIWFDNVHFYLGASDMTAGRPYTLAIKDILLVYKDFVVSGIESIITNNFSVYPNPATNQTIYLQLKSNDTQKLRTEIYNLVGQLLASHQHGNYKGGLIPISVNNLSPGTYILRVYEDERFIDSKIRVE